MSQPNNSKIILDQIVDRKQKEVAPEMSKSDFFEFFTTELILSPYDLSYTELEGVVMGGGGDGGIDGIATIVNGNLVAEDTDLSAYKDNIRLEVYIVQAKTSASFNEDPINRLLASSTNIFDLDKPITELNKVYSQNVVQAAETFRRTYLTLATKFPTIDIRYYYATKGNVVHPNVEKRKKHLIGSVEALIQNSNVTFDFLGSRELLDLAQESKTEALKLPLAENPISPGEDSFICLVHLGDYYRFITTEEGLLRKKIFDANVRDYEGEVTVNKGIKLTLQNDKTEDFWWLNNGITIVANKATSAGKSLNIDNAKVVNGLQTSQEIYKHFRGEEKKKDERSVLVRVVIPKTEDSKNNIIKATNNQTRIPAASLRATDSIQQDIEQYFESKSLYYDRRKNYYKNIGKPKSKIVSIPYLAQAVTSILLQEPNNSRGRPTTLIQKDEEYQKIFNHDYPIQLYLECANFYLRIEEYIKDCASKEVKNERNNIKHHLAMFAAAKQLETYEVKPEMLNGSIPLSDMTNDEIESSLKDVWTIMTKLATKPEFENRMDRVAKSRKADEALLKKLEAQVKKAQTKKAQSK